MKSQIIQYILSLFNDSATQNMATQVGESKGNVQNALESIIPLIMRGFASKSAEGQEQVNNILDLATSATESSWFQKVTDWFTDSDILTKGKEILHDLFGGHNNVQRIADSVASHNNIKPSSAVTLMQWAAPLCLGALGKHIGDSKLNAGSLASWLSKEKLELDTVIPPVIGAATGTAAATAARPHQAAAAANFAGGAADRKSGGSKLLLPLLLLLLLGGLIWWFMSKKSDTGSGTVTTDSVAANSAPANPGPTAPQVTMPAFKWNADSSISYTYSDTVTEKLPDGTELRIPGNGAEAMLLKNIRMAMEKGLDTTAEGKKAGWINLYDIQFSKGLTYRAGAAEQINNITTILKAYPAVHIKLGGYTDNTGPADVNTKLSQQRADKVSADLGGKGVAAQLDKAEGYGPEFPVADNATAEGRAQNRRVSCRIVSIAK